MALRFTQDELEDRRHKVTAEMQSGLDPLLIFRQESMYYLTAAAPLLRNLAKVQPGSLSAWSTQMRTSSIIEVGRVWRRSAERVRRTRMPSAPR